MKYITTGEIQKLDYDKVVDIERIAFSDKKLKTDNYIEIPRSVASFQQEKSITVELKDEEIGTKDTEKAKMILNTRLYMIRQSKAAEDEEIIQFSSGGLIFRITTKNKPQEFRTRGKQRYKLIIY